MRFELTSEQEDFAQTLDKLLSGADTVSAARAWADGNSAPGLEVWRRLAELGVTGLLVPEEAGGMDATPVELAVALESLGRHAVPGPWVESVAFLPSIERVVTVAAPPHTPYALDADVADAVFLLGDDGLREASVGELVRSVDPTRRLFAVTPGEPTEVEAPAGAFDLAVLATSAQLLGCGERLLADTVEYARQRRQFGREIGSYQAVKHALADVRIALDFARPLVLGAAVLGWGARDVSAAKVAAGDAAYLASRVALQVHGAIGYTREYDLSLWITKVRALVGAWGTPSFHRARVLEALSSTGPGGP
jgi:alkylation response protein AidB-like acyl-CoA dehydrogenase